MRLIHSKAVTTIILNFMLASIIVLFIMMLSSCNDNNDKTMAHLSVRMTDAPGNFTAVLVDIRSIEVTGNGGKAIILNTKAGIYNLLNFSNGLDTLIATGDVEPSSISQIRLILGPNNSVIVDGVTYPLSTPSAEQSGLKLQIHKTFEAGVSYSILLDFDANQSIVLKGNNEYQLKPVIRTIDTAISGSLKGSITPVGILAVVTVTSNGISYSTITNLAGKFMIAGLPAGSYNITVTPPLPRLPFSVTGKTVVIGASTDLGIIVL